MNYIILAVGVFAVLAATMLIFLDRLKGEDMYFNMDVKEQEIKKVIEDADEIITELNYTAEMVVKEIEEKMRDLREDIKNLNNTTLNSTTVESIIPQIAKPSAIVASKKKKVTNDDTGKDMSDDIKLNQKQQTVFEYASQGMSVIDIAKQMNIGQGEVMLILSLKNEVE
jgi:DNA-binding NarL/FixJ family response regulator